MCIDSYKYIYVYIYIYIYPPPRSAQGCAEVVLLSAVDSLQFAVDSLQFSVKIVI